MVAAYYVRLRPYSRSSMRCVRLHQCSTGIGTFLLQKLPSRPSPCRTCLPCSLRCAARVLRCLSHPQDYKPYKARTILAKLICLAFFRILDRLLRHNLLRGTFGLITVYFRQLAPAVVRLLHLGLVFAFSMRVWVTVFFTRTIRRTPSTRLPHYLSN